MTHKLWVLANLQKMLQNNLDLTNIEKEFLFREDLIYFHFKERKHFDPFNGLKIVPLLIIICKVDEIMDIFGRKQSSYSGTCWPLRKESIIRS